MKKTLFITALLLLPIIWMIWVIDSVQPVYNTYNQDIASREQASLNMTIPKYSINKTFLLNHTTGTPVKFHVVKFECCNRIGGMVKDGELYMGYLNEGIGQPITSTTTQMIPELEMNVLIHELVHLGTLHFVSTCPDFSTNVCQEKIAYNVEHLYTQIKSLEEDNYFKLNK